uniref:PBECR2 nuclease fold domain-containing protein n=1 Tax=uncultured Mucilaginibacter sp. TaxID=797541 RepID=UPI0025EC5134
NPDEIWSNRVKDKLSNIYLKYYDGAPIALVVDAEKSLRAVTLYEVKKGGQINYKALQNMRKGILKYKNR